MKKYLYFNQKKSMDFKKVKKEILIVMKKLSIINQITIKYVT